MGEDFSIKELMACRLSRELSDGEKTAVGANFPIPRAAVLLAHLLRGPNMGVSIGMFTGNFIDEATVSTVKFLAEYKAVQWGEAASDFVIDFQAFRKLDVFFIGGIQIDKYGNTNLIGIRGEKPGTMKMRGPGSIGTATLSALAKRYYIVTENHTRRLFVENVDFVSGLGFGKGESGLRERLCLPGSGPRLAITPLCVFDFENSSKQMRIVSLHPGVSLDEVIQNTGFEPIIPKDIPVTEPPTQEEIECLRTRIDPEGTLRN